MMTITRFKGGSRMDHGNRVDAVTDRSVDRRENTGLCRRSLNNRREAHHLDYFTDGGVEGRRRKERRRPLIETRKGWVRVSDWTSAMVGPSFRQRSTQDVYRIDEGLGRFPHTSTTA